MPVTSWQFSLDGQVWGAGGPDGIQPDVLARFVEANAGERRVTYFGKPYTLDPADPDSVYDYFDSEIDPKGDRKMLDWQYTPSPGEFDDDVVY